STPAAPAPVPSPPSSPTSSPRRARAPDPSHTARNPAAIWAVDDRICSELPKFRAVQEPEGLEVLPGSSAVSAEGGAESFQALGDDGVADPSPPLLSRDDVT